MKRFRISGLVGLAKRVRQELAGPVSPERLGQIRWDIELARMHFPAVSSTSVRQTCPYHE